MLLSVSGFALIAYLPSLAGCLEYDRQAVCNGEWWRLVTGHFTHWNMEHLIYDVAAFICLSALYLQSRPDQYRWLVFSSSALISLILLVGVAEMGHYRGLSGIDTALFGGLMVIRGKAMVRNGHRRRFICLCGLGAAAILKLAYEINFNTGLFVSNMGDDIVVVPLAHLLGGLLGALMASWPERFSPHFSPVQVRRQLMPGVNRLEENSQAGDVT
jgi:rhomboid family GlyGly-CTERM serine protease